jgi:hypothetical protein
LSLRAIFFRGGEKSFSPPRKYFLAAVEFLLGGGERKVGGDAWIYLYSAA